MTTQQTLPPEAREAIDKLEDSRRKLEQDREFVAQALETARQRLRLGLGSTNALQGEIVSLEQRLKEIERRLEGLARQQELLEGYWARRPSLEAELEERQQRLQETLERAEEAVQRLLEAYRAAWTPPPPLRRPRCGSTPTRPPRTAGRRRRCGRRGCGLVPAWPASSVRSCSWTCGRGQRLAMTPVLFHCTNSKEGFMSYEFQAYLTSGSLRQLVEMVAGENATKQGWNYRIRVNYAGQLQVVGPEGRVLAEIHPDWPSLPRV